MSLGRLKGSLVTMLMLALLVSVGINVWWFRSEGSWRELSPVCWPNGRDAHFLVGDVSWEFKREVVVGRTFVRLRLFADPNKDKIRVEVQENERAGGRKILLGGELATRSTQVAVNVQRRKTGRSTPPQAGDTCDFVATWLIEPVGKAKKVVCYKRRCAATVSGE